MAATVDVWCDMHPLTPVSKPKPMNGEFKLILSLCLYYHCTLVTIATLDPEAEPKI